MESKITKDQRVDINFESHPPIADDLNGIATLLRQTLLQYVDCQPLASYLISQKDTTQVIAQEAPEEEHVSEDEEPDDDIYGVVSVIDLTSTRGSAGESGDPNYLESKGKLIKFLKDKCPKLEEAFSDNESKERFGMIVNERYINLPPQLSLPTLKALTQTLDKAKYTQLIFVSKILVKARDSGTKLPSKKTKTSTGDQSTSGYCAPDESIIFVNAEEEIIFEKCKYHADFDVSAQVDENATWSFNSDIKYIPHRRILIVDYKRWPEILKSLEEELK